MQQQAKLCLPQGYQSTSMKQAPQHTCFCNPSLRSYQVQLSYPTRMAQIAARAGRTMLTSCCLNSLPCAEFPQKETLQACPILSPSSGFTQQQVCPRSGRSHLSSLSNVPQYHSISVHKLLRQSSAGPKVRACSNSATRLLLPLTELPPESSNHQVKQKGLQPLACTGTSQPDPATISYLPQDCCSLLVTQNKLTEALTEKNHFPLHTPPLIKTSAEGQRKQMTFLTSSSPSLVLFIISQANLDYRLFKGEEMEQ